MMKAFTCSPLKTQIFVCKTSEVQEVVYFISVARTICVEAEEVVGNLLLGDAIIYYQHASVSMITVFKCNASTLAWLLLGLF